MKMLSKVTGEGSPIVLVPGGLTGWLSWEPHAERLARTRRVARVQLLPSNASHLRWPLCPTRRGNKPRKPAPSLPGAQRSRVQQAQLTLDARSTILDQKRRSE